MRLPPNGAHRNRSRRSGPSRGWPPAARSGRADTGSARGGRRARGDRSAGPSIRTAPRPPDSRPSDTGGATRSRPVPRRSRRAWPPWSPLPGLPTRRRPSRAARPMRHRCPRPRPPGLSPGPARGRIRPRTPPSGQVRPAVPAALRSRSRRAGHDPPSGPPPPWPRPPGRRRWRCAPGTARPSAAPGPPGCGERWASQGPARPSSRQCRR